MNVQQKKILMSVAAFVGVSTFALSAAALDSQSKTYDLEGFTGVASSAAIDMKVTVGEAYAVRAESSTDDGLDRLVLDVRGDTLVAKRQKKKGLNLSWNDNARIVVHVSMPQLESVDTSSAAEITVTGVSGGDVDLDASSGSDIVISGTCETVSADASSGADINARNLECENARADASSGADIYLYATKDFRGDASSGADIVVYGSPEQSDSNSSSGGDVTIKR